MSRSTRMMALLLAGLALAGSISAPNLLQASVSSLASPFHGVSRQVDDFRLVNSAPMREGLRWIEVSDPRDRRTDKLHSGRQ